MMRIPVKALGLTTIITLISSTGLLARDLYGRKIAQDTSCHLVAGASLNYPAEFVADAAMPSVPSLIDSSNSFSARSEGVRLKVMRIYYVAGTTVDPSASIQSIVGFWKTLADSGKITTRTEPRTVSGTDGQLAEATFSLQGQAVRGQALSVARERTLWQFISVYPDTPYGQSLIQRAFASLSLPGKCG